MAKVRNNSSARVMVEASTFGEHLRSNAWIGVGAAVDWIALRGKQMPLSAYEKRIDDAASALVEALRRLSPAECLAVIEGVPSSDPVGPHAPIPYGVWPNVKATEADFRTGAFNLLLIDDTDEWGGTLAGRRETFAQLRVRTDFIQERWPAGSLELNPAEQVRARTARTHSRADLRRFLEHLIALTPDNLASLRVDEVESIVRDKFRNASRDSVRSNFIDLRPKHWPAKPGPRGPKDPGRKARFHKFRDKMISAEWRN